MKRLILLSVLLLALPGDAWAEDLKDLLVSAMKASEQQPSQQARLTFVRDGGEVEYVIERVQPDRLHMTSSNGSAGSETFVIGDEVYQRTGAGWARSYAAQAPAVFSVAALFDDGLQNVIELDPVVAGGQQRVFSAEIDWYTARNHNSGTIEVWLEEATSLPSRMSFAGTCGSVRCEFVQAMAYDASVVIEAPE